MTYVQLKAVSHYAANLLQPAIDGYEIRIFPIFCFNLHWSIQRTLTIGISMSDLLFILFGSCRFVYVELTSALLI